jgi:NAD(P)-dependent dehydrogenase (short-subunit alcohol dehydrogenase family)
MSGPLLKDKVAIVTGAGDPEGIGCVTARTLAEEGAKVVLADLPGTQLEAAAAHAGEAGTVAHHLVDISDEAAVKALVAFTVEHFGRLDIVDNNAAAVVPNPFEDSLVTELEPDLWDWVFSVNARGTMLMCKHTIPHMVRAGGGSIINIMSDSYARGDNFPTAYACSKGALFTLTKYVATQFGSRGVRCNAISPGLMRSRKMEQTMPQPVQDVFIRHTPLGYLGLPVEIAKGVLFLASDLASFVTGEVIHVSGGALAPQPWNPGLRDLAQQLQSEPS